MERVSEFKPHIAHIAVQACYAGMNIIVRLALDKGMNPFVYVAYRQAVATFVMAPVAYFLERKERPAMTCVVFWQIFLLALGGISFNEDLYFAGLAKTSSTFASATKNLIPVVTLIMATAFRLEKVDVRSRRGQAKVIGTIICVGRAMIMTLYKGPSLTGTQHHLLKLNKWMLGALLLFGSCFLWSAWLIFQGVLCSAFAIFVQAYCINEKGPVFPVLFNPLATVLVAVLELFILHVKLHVGSVVGGVLIIAGLYIVLWGKANDKKETDQRKDGLTCGSNSTIDSCPVETKQPLLENEGYHHSDEEISHI